ncbi:MAG: PQQ-binding-like beta-propeller repeat protein [bacterium]|nr:PQQ-binding-like beta-propeller repeat protein [bacterium]
MRYLILLFVLITPGFALTDIAYPQGDPLSFPDAADYGTVTAASIDITDEGRVIATDLSASLYDFYGYVRPRYIRVYDGWNGEQLYNVDTLGEGDGRREPFATDGRYHSYYFTTDGRVYHMNDRDGSVIWESDVGGTVLEPPVLANGRVYVVSGHHLITLDAAGGDELWRTWYRYRLDTPVAVVGNIVRVGAIDRVEKPKLKPYTKRRDVVFDGISGGVIGGEYFQKDETARAAIFEHFYSDKTLYIDKINPGVNFVAGVRSRSVFDYDGVVYIETTGDEVTTYDRTDGDKFWTVKDVIVEGSSPDAVVLKNASAESSRYRCLSSGGEDLWGEEVGDLVALDFDAEFAITRGEGVVRRPPWGGKPGWTAPYEIYDYYGKDDSRLYSHDGRELIALDLTTGDKEWSLSLNARANYVDIIAGRPVIFNAFFIYALDPSTGDELWRVKSDRSFATKNANRDSPYVYTASGDTLFIIHSNDVVSAIVVTTGDVLWHRRFDFRTDMVKRTHCSDGLLVLEGNDGYYYVMDADDGSPVCKYRCEMMGDVWPERQPVGFIVGADPYAIWYGFKLP